MAEALTASRKTMDALLRAVEGVLAELGATEPGAAERNGDIEAPASILLDHLYDCWNQAMREIHGDSLVLMDPDGFDDEDLARLRAGEPPL